jgi:hypothetical protein
LHRERHVRSQLIKRKLRLQFNKLPVPIEWSSFEWDLYHFYEQELWAKLELMPSHIHFPPLLHVPFFFDYILTRLILLSRMVLSFSLRVGTATPS